MAQIFREGEMKVRPDVYYRYSDKGTAGNVGAVDGIAALVIKSSWGPLGEVGVFTKAAEVKEVYGDCDGAKMVAAMFEEGARTVYIYRAGGENGEKATLQQGEGLAFAAKHQGKYSIKIKVQKKLADNVKQCMIIVGEEVKEKYSVPATGIGEAAALAEQLKYSAYITATTATVADIPEFEAELSGGQDPTVTAGGYSEGFYALEPYFYNTICCDTVDDGIQGMLMAYINEAIQTGKFPIGITGTVMSKTFAERCAKASDYNNPQIAFIGNTYVDKDGESVAPTMAVARLAGSIAATPSNQSIIHRTIKGALDVEETFTNAQYEEAITSGMILFSKSAEGQVWFDSGVTTLTVLEENQDAGWKKVKRTKVRNELMHRLDTLMEKKIGKINCDADGIADVLQSGMGLLNDMANEKKILAGATFALDTENPETSDSAWFVIEADDIDTLEKIYLHYRFSNAPTV